MLDFMQEKVRSDRPPRGNQIGEWLDKLNTGVWGAYPTPSASGVQNIISAYIPVSVNCDHSP